MQSFSLKNYLIFYRPIDEGIEIARILHGSQDIETIFKNEG
ncbi:type II toxin-antitoxin system RelE/ParE family toxin [uncultured Nostoc sp.]